MDLKLSMAQEDILFVADSTGHISQWKWREGTEISRKQLNRSIRGFAATFDPVASIETLFLIADTIQSEDGQSCVLAVGIKDNTESPDWQVDILRYTDIQLRHIVAAPSGRQIFAASESTLLLGLRERRETRIRWKSFNFPQGVACITTYVVKAQTSHRKYAGLDLAIGGKDGSIWIYENITLLVTMPQGLRGQKKHWHRFAVGAIKYSADGKSIPSRFELLFIVLTSRRELSHIRWA